jgi:N-hydroxyarylamine O-acetyltransferase
MNSPTLDPSAYLKRIDYSGPLDSTAETLRELQIAHLLSVPFENLSIQAGESIVLNDADLFKKVVLRRRGGFCYELNGLFASLLRAIGFDVEMLSASVANSEGEWGPEFDHMTLLVNLEQRWLTDVGFGDSFVEPLLLDNRADQKQGRRSYRIDEEAGRLTLLQKEEGGDWKPQYRFTLEPHVYSDYDEMCRYQQTSPESHFTQGRICSKLTSAGRITISKNRLVSTTNNRKEERELTEDELKKALSEHFGIVMSD